MNEKYIYKYKVAFLGLGRMGIALSSLLVQKCMFENNRIVGTHYNLEKKAILLNKLRFNVENSNRLAVKQSKIIFICVRPQQLNDLVSEIKNEVKQHHVIVSLAVGVPIKWLRKKLPEAAAIFHVHPSSLVMVNSPGFSFISHEDNTDSKYVIEIENIFNSLGPILNVAEDKIDKYAVFSGCSPAFFARMGSVWSDLAYQYGISSEDSVKIVNLLFIGLSHGLNVEKLDLSTIENNIATPNGITELGLNTLMAEDIEKVFRTVVDSCLQKTEGIRTCYESV